MPVSLDDEIPYLLQKGFRVEFSRKRGESEVLVTATCRNTGWRLTARSQNPEDAIEEILRQRDELLRNTTPGRDGHGLAVRVLRILGLR